MSVRVHREVAKVREVVEDNRAALRFLIGRTLRKQGVRGWRKRAELADAMLAARKSNSHDTPEPS